MTPSLEGVKLRVRLPAGGNSGQAVTISMNDGFGVPGINEFFAKEWSIDEDILNVADSASVSISNEEGQNSGKFSLGQRIEIDESDPKVAGGSWVRHFTGRVTDISTYSDVAGGSNIMLTAMDLGWHLTSSCAPPLDSKGRHISLRSATLQTLIDKLLDPTWGFGPTQTSNNLNKSLKLGRVLINQFYNKQYGQVFPPIQVEIGQTPIDLIMQYAAREGLLVNVSARGELVLFQPTSTGDPQYSAEYYGSSDPRRNNTNIVGKPSLKQSISGLYSESQCWSTIVHPSQSQEARIAVSPNEQFTHSIFKAPELTNPLPFRRAIVFSDSEAINATLRKNRAIWKQQMEAFSSWVYSCEFPGHSQGGVFFTTDTLIAVIDTINAVKGMYYVKHVRRSCTLQEGLKTSLEIHKKDLLNPQLGKLPDRGKTKKTKAPTP